MLTARLLPAAGLKRSPKRSDFGPALTPGETPQLDLGCSAWARRSAERSLHMHGCNLFARPVFMNMLIAGGRSYSGWTLNVCCSADAAWLNVWRTFPPACGCFCLQNWGLRLSE